MPKAYTIRGRVSVILKDRLRAFIDNENRRGRSIDESGVVRDAVVEYLDRMEERPDILRRAELNERDEVSSGSAAADAVAEATAAEVAKKASATRGK